MLTFDMEIVKRFVCTTNWWAALSVELRKEDGETEKAYRYPGLQ